MCDHRSCNSNIIKVTANYNLTQTNGLCISATVLTINKFILTTVHIIIIIPYVLFFL